MCTRKVFLFYGYFQKQKNTCENIQKFGHYRDDISFFLCYPQKDLRELSILYYYHAIKIGHCERGMWIHKADT